MWISVRIYREGLVQALSGDPRVGAVCAVAEPEACMQMAAEDGTRVAVIDAGSPVATEIAAGLRGRSSGVVALGIAEREADVVSLARAGVSAYLTQDEPLDQLVEAILAVSRGEAECSPRVTALLLRHVASTAAEPAQDPRTVRLTRREVEVLALMRSGLSNKQIGARLSIELPTVKNHVHSVLTKLGAATRAEAVALTRGSRPFVAVEPTGATSAFAA